MDIIITRYFTDLMLQNMMRLAFKFEMLFNNKKNSFSVLSFISSVNEVLICQPVNQYYRAIKMCKENFFWSCSKFRYISLTAQIVNET